jgi:uncharacterized phage infection (PIP) family protein YhgE
MPVTLPSVSDQLAAALSAPIPLLFALGVGVFVIWRVFEWRYQAVIEKTRSLYELSQSAAQIAQQVATDKEIKLSGTIDDLNKQLKELTANVDKQPKQAAADVIPALEQLNQTSTLANNQLVELRKANSTVADTLRSMGHKAPSKLETMLEEIRRNDPSTRFEKVFSKSQGDG